MPGGQPPPAASERVGRLTASPPAGAEWRGGGWPLVSRSRWRDRAAIGAGGLGVLLFRGIARSKRPESVQGAVPAAAGMACATGHLLQPSDRLLAGLGLAYVAHGPGSRAFWLAALPPHPRPCDRRRRPFSPKQLLLRELLGQEIEARTQLRCAVTSALVAPRVAMRRAPARSPVTWSTTAPPGFTV